jgi:hypothetical protein
VWSYILELIFALKSETKLLVAHSLPVKESNEIVRIENWAGVGGGGGRVSPGAG